MAAFDVLYKHAGRQAVDDILPGLLDDLASADETASARALEVGQTAAQGGAVYGCCADLALRHANVKPAAPSRQGLRQITSVRSTIVFPILMEKLLAHMTPSKAKGGLPATAPGVTGSC